ncbi:hypothetical protein C8T65DRAFT_662322 [Cerioporus squamosus]|nr:hypothetical protein C8T65DRAFT_662322 [Cerioporus squamosus]
MNEAPYLCGLSDLLEDLAVVYALKFHSRTSLVKISEGAASQKPPRKLYFYERVHDYPHASLDPKINWPWGFWSTNPNDQCEITTFDINAHTSAAASSRHSITFLGVSQDREFTWAQQLGSWMFYIEVRVEVEYYKLTSEECLVLQEMDRYSGDNDADSEGRFEEISDTDEVVGEGKDSDMIEDEDAWTSDDSDSSENSEAFEQFDDWYSDESRTAEGLEWLSLSASMTRPRGPPPLGNEKAAQYFHTWVTRVTRDMLYEYLREQFCRGSGACAMLYDAVCRVPHRRWYGF